MKKILITHAVEQEQVDLYIPDAEIRVVLTGVGKANAAMNLTAAIMEDKPDLVLNVGTAGTLKHQVGDIFMCHQFLDRDLISLKLNGVIAELQTAVPEWVSPCSWVGQRLVTGDFYVIPVMTLSQLMPIFKVMWLTWKDLLKLWFVAKWECR